jgi:hypothetical protein
VKRYDGATGAFIDTFVPERSGGLKRPSMMTFTQTDPVTLAYLGDDRLTAACFPAQPLNQQLGAETVRPLLTEALTRWQAAGMELSILGAIDIRVDNLGGAAVGLAAGHTIWLDDNAAGWGGFVDPTPREDSEFTTPGNQGERGRMDLLTVLEHEIGHLLGRGHEAEGVMQEALGAGLRRAGGPTPAKDAGWPGAAQALLAWDADAPWIDQGFASRHGTRR